MFSELVIAYLFCGGTGAGLLVSLSVLGLVRMRRFVPALQGSFFSRAWAVCLGLLVFSIVMLLADLGRPERAGLILEFPHLTGLTFGAVSLGASILVAFFLLALLFSEHGVLSARNRPLVMFLLVAGVICGVGVACYTGVLLSGMPSVLAWRTPLVPLVFACSSLSCGVSLTCGLLAESPGRRAFAESRARLCWMLMRTDSCLIAVELVLLACYILWCAAGTATAPAASALAFGRLASPFWFCLVVVGLLAPLALELSCLLGQRVPVPSLPVAACACVLVGGAALRWCVVGVSAFDPVSELAAMSAYIPLSTALGA